MPNERVAPEKIRCDACPVMCYIADGKVGACDRYANQGGDLIRLDALTILESAQNTRVVPFLQDNRSPGQVLDVPLGHKDAAYVRSHFDGIEVRLNDAPRANEIMVAVAVTDRGRPLPQVGGLTHKDTLGTDGLR